jgi:hypothetical protein
MSVSRLYLINRIATSAIVGTAVFCFWLLFLLVAAEGITWDAIVFVILLGFFVFTFVIPILIVFVGIGWIAHRRITRRPVASASVAAVITVAYVLGLMSMLDELTSQFVYLVTASTVAAAATFCFLTRSSHSEGKIGNN